MYMEVDDVEVVKKIIEKNNKDTNGSCGVYIAAIQQQTNFPMEKLNKILRELYNQKFFKLREGLNGKLIFKNKKAPQ